jgi:hypothetical protein
MTRLRDVLLSPKMLDAYGFALGVLVMLAAGGQLGPP